MPKISEYKLKATDVDTARRNFPSFEKKQYFNLADIQAGDTEGTTDTDSKTDIHTGTRANGYTRINKKSGKSYG